MLPLYKSIVQPHLEYAVQLWFLHLCRDIDKMEIVEIKDAKMIPKIWNHSYWQRLKDLELISLVQKRLQGQLIEVFKYLNRFNNDCTICLFNNNFNDRMQNTGKKLIVKRFNTSVAQHFSPINITTTWNALPYAVVNSKSVNTLKNHLDARRSTGNTDWCSQHSMDSGGPCMVESKPSHH